MVRVREECKWEQRRDRYNGRERERVVPTHTTGNGVTHAHSHMAYTHTYVAPFHTQALHLSLHLFPHERGRELFPHTPRATASHTHMHTRHIHTHMLPHSTHRPSIFLSISVPHPPTPGNGVYLQTISISLLRSAPHTLRSPVASPPRGHHPPCTSPRRWCDCYPRSRVSAAWSASTRNTARGASARPTR